MPGMTNNRSAERRLALVAELGSDAAHAGDCMDAPWSVEALRATQAELQSMDVCGAMDDCAAGRCPCALLAETGADTSQNGG